MNLVAEKLRQYLTKKKWYSFAAVLILLAGSVALHAKASQETPAAEEMVSKPAEIHTAVQPARQTVRGEETSLAAVRIQDPFSLRHENRQAAVPAGDGYVQIKQSAEQKTNVPEKNVTLPAVPVVQQPVVLKGILYGSAHREAVLSVDGKDFPLAEGEAHEGVRLLRVEQQAVVIQDAAGEHILSW